MRPFLPGKWRLSAEAQRVYEIRDPDGKSAKTRGATLIDGYRETGILVDSQRFRGWGAGFHGVTRPARTGPGGLILSFANDADFSRHSPAPGSSTMMTGSRELALTMIGHVP